MYMYRKQQLINKCIVLINISFWKENLSRKYIVIWGEGGDTSNNYDYAQTFFCFGSLTAFIACSIQRGSSWRISNTGVQHWVLSANLAVQQSNSCWSTLYIISTQPSRKITYINKGINPVNCGNTYMSTGLPSFTIYRGSNAMGNVVQ